MAVGGGADDESSDVVIDDIEDDEEEIYLEPVPELSNAVRNRKRRYGRRTHAFTKECRQVPPAIKVPKRQRVDEE